jgi:hypothetical protein
MFTNFYDSNLLNFSIRVVFPGDNWVIPEGQQMVLQGEGVVMDQGEIEVSDQAEVVIL